MRLLLSYLHCFTKVFIQTLLYVFLWIVYSISKITSVHPTSGTKIFLLLGMMHEIALLITIKLTLSIIGDGSQFTMGSL